MHYSFKSSKKYPSSLKGMYLLLLFKQPVTSRDKTWNSSDNIYKFIKKKNICKFNNIQHYSGEKNNIYRQTGC